MHSKEALIKLKEDNMFLNEGDNHNFEDTRVNTGYIKNHSKVGVENSDKKKSKQKKINVIIDTPLNNVG